MRFLYGTGAAALLATNVLGHPAASHSKGALQARKIDLSMYRLTTTSTYANATVVAESESGIVANLTRREDYVATATALVEGVQPGKEFRLVDDHYVGSNGIAHVNFKQTIHGLDVDNADFNVNVSENFDIGEMYHC